MITTAELIHYLDELLAVDAVRDYAPNGLQVEGRAEVRRIVSGVTANQALIDAAIEERADLLLVHHGFFWRGEDARLIGIKQRRLKALLGADLNLAAYHLPLDLHPQLGNNAQLAQRLGVKRVAAVEAGGIQGLLWHGYFDPPLSVDELAARIMARLDREPLSIRGGDQPIRHLAWCTGSAQGYIQQALELGVDAYLSGEISEPTVHLARESGIHYFSAGHHATERYGPEALGIHLAEKYDLYHRFIDIDNPV